MKQLLIYEVAQKILYFNTLPGQHNVHMWERKATILLCPSILEVYITYISFRMNPLLRKLFFSIFWKPMIN